MPKMPKIKLTQIFEISCAIRSRVQLLAISKKEAISRCQLISES
jgi:hypothetical protein